ncbi:hypothetical protein PanWU01x14_263250 [Parasponia andersonii]|uniref:Uncharacterized protein n=1 Tax=Parasponia andersonii TaxID=3476 RepID=A0A2P5B7T2_PARAD|nr:hypothetical protein PanWU01x14_263250 [Parasponia andersonii]
MFIAEYDKAYGSVVGPLYLNSVNGGVALDGTLVCLLTRQNYPPTIVGPTPPHRVWDPFVAVSHP